MIAREEEKGREEFTDKRRDVEHALSVDRSLSSNAVLK
jgi:hypothetical protein